MFVSTEVIIPPIQLDSFNEMMVKALAIAQTVKCSTVSNTEYEILICTKSFHKHLFALNQFWVPEDHNMQNCTNEDRGLHLERCV